MECPFSRFISLLLSSAVSRVFLRVFFFRPFALSRPRAQDLVDIYLRTVQKGDGKAPQNAGAATDVPLAKMTPAERKKELARRNMEAQKEKVCLKKKRKEKTSPRRGSSLKPASVASERDTRFFEIVACPRLWHSLYCCVFFCAQGGSLPPLP